MVRPMPNHGAQTYNYSSTPLAIGLFVTVSLIVGLCAKHARKYKSKKSNAPENQMKSPLPSAAKQMITTMGHKAMVRLVHAKKSGVEFNSKIFGNNKKLLGHEESGVWQKAILMGEKCKPPEFSGVIYYDHDGNRIPEMPKSPRLGPTGPSTKIDLPAEKLDKSMYSD